MADERIVAALTARPGQGQPGRMPPELGAHHADVDERTPEDLLRFAQALGGRVSFFDPATFDPATRAPSGDWSGVFDPPAGASGPVPPHLALYGAFLDLYRVPQGLANRFTGRHLDFFYRDVLRLRPRGPAADRAHLLLELKKGASPVLVTPEHSFGAGKDAAGAELVYAPTGETTINAAKVESLRSVYLDGAGTVRFAPIADSADGLGGKLPADEPKWKAFGHDALPRAEVGFALASPVLRMREGERTATLRLELSGADAAVLTAARLHDAFSVHLTGEKGWIEPASAVVSLSGGTLTCVATLPAGAGAVVDYDAAVHGYAYAATAPVAQLLLREGAQLAFTDFRGVAVQSASVQASVYGVTSLALESDAGSLNPKKAFLPFGPQPGEGARFLVGYPEALGKALSELRVSLRWKDAPQDFGTLYDGYAETAVGNASFTAAARFVDGAGTDVAASAVPLFGDDDARAPHDLVFHPGETGGGWRARPGREIRALRDAGATWSVTQARRMSMERPVLGASAAAAGLTYGEVELGTASPSPFSQVPEPTPGFLTLVLNRGFLHAEYRRAYVTAVVTAAGNAPDLPPEPYTPTVQSISLAYTAHSRTVAVSSAALDDFADPDVQFFQVGPFGPRREHGYQRAQLGIPGAVELLPAMDDRGELLIGVSSLVAGDSVSLLFQVAEGSADPSLGRQPVRWSVLCNDHWAPLAPRDLALDTTNGLLASGIVRVLVPAAATIANTFLPAGLLWLKASIAGEVDAVCQLVSVAANGIEVELLDPEIHAAHLAAPLPARAIGKVRSAPAALKSIAQPHASFGGCAPEDDASFHARASERLRHRGRCVSPWDYERAVLEAFPAIHRAKCIPHSRQGAWDAPGNVLVVVVPDLRNRNAVDPLRPRADADTLDRVTKHLQERTGMGVTVRVANPRYQPVRLDFAVAFRFGVEVNGARARLNAELVGALSPWAFGGEGTEISFGGAVYRSVLLNFVEERPYVDYVTDFRLFTTPPGAAEREVRDARPAAPDAILVSAPDHTLRDA